MSVAIWKTYSASQKSKEITTILYEKFEKICYKEEFYIVPANGLIPTDTRYTHWKPRFVMIPTSPGIILCMRLANERQNDP